MKITENKKGRCTGCCAAALSAGLDGTYDFLLVAPVFLHPAEKDAKNHLTNCYGGGPTSETQAPPNRDGGMQKDCEVDSYV